MNGWVSENAKYVITNVGYVVLLYGICQKSGIFKSRIFKMGVD